METNPTSNFLICHIRGNPKFRCHSLMPFGQLCHYKNCPWLSLKFRFLYDFPILLYLNFKLTDTTSPGRSGSAGFWMATLPSSCTMWLYDPSWTSPPPARLLLLSDRASIWFRVSTSKTFLMSFRPMPPNLSSYFEIVLPSLVRCCLAANFSSSSVLSDSSSHRVHLLGNMRATGLCRLNWLKHLQPLPWWSTSGSW